MNESIIECPECNCKIPIRWKTKEEMQSKPKEDCCDMSETKSRKIDKVEGQINAEKTQRQDEEREFGKDANGEEKVQ